MRKGLSLAPLFAKPRPLWADPVFIATFGDAFIERTQLEGTSSLARSFSVLNFILERLIDQPLLIPPTDEGPAGAKDDGEQSGPGLGKAARASFSDCLHVMRQSEIVFKMALKVKNDSSLLAFLKKLKKLINNVNAGESLLMPVYVEGEELAMLLERTSERYYRVVIIQTDPNGGLRHHAANAAIAMPYIKFRTCMVLNGLPKKNVLDDVFWLALYNMKIHPHRDDRVKFYDVLLPFLTGKPLEVSLIEAENASRGIDHSLDSVSSLQASSKPAPAASEEAGVDEEKALELMTDATAAAGAEKTADAEADAEAENERVPEGFGLWRSPQRSMTAYVRLFLEALHYMLRRRRVTELEANQVSHYSSGDIFEKW